MSRCKLRLRRIWSRFFAGFDVLLCADSGHSWDWCRTAWFDPKLKSNVDVCPTYVRHTSDW
jgi:hypothetical protein